MPKKKTKPQVEGAASATVSKLPKGFTVVPMGSYAPKHDFDKEDTLQGVCLEVKTVTVGSGKKQRECAVATIEKIDGSRVVLWESAGLAGLFEQLKPKQRVWVHFDGLVKIKGRAEPMRTFTAGIG
ncbi:MAG: hypothetical protein ACYCVY_13065 [Acidiferrobacteraceae bacterium]